MGDPSKAMKQLLQIPNAESLIPASNYSARGSCRLRSRAASFLEAGNIDRCSFGGRSRPGVGQPGMSQTCVNQKTPEGRHHLRRPAPCGNRLSGCAGSTATPCQCEHPCPSSIFDTTAPAVFDGYRPRLAPAIAFKMSVTRNTGDGLPATGRSRSRKNGTAGRTGSRGSRCDRITSATGSTGRPSRPGPWSSSATPSAGRYPWRWPAWP